MSAVPLFYARVDKADKVIFDSPLSWGREVHRLRGQAVELTIRKRRTQRSLKQNRAYFGLIVEAVADHCGYSKDEAHEALAWRFLREGEPDALLPRRKSTADLSTKEFEDYTARVKQFAAEELGLFIPDPQAVDL
jgi:hypothetical protein